MDRLDKVKKKISDQSRKAIDDEIVLNSLLKQQLITEQEAEEYLKDSNFGLKAKTKEERRLAKTKLAIAYTQLYAGGSCGIGDYMEGDRSKVDEIIGGRNIVFGNFDLNEYVYKDLMEDRSLEELEEEALDRKVKSLFELSQTFVRAKRERLRRAFFLLLRVDIAVALLRPEEEEGFLTAPHLRAAAKNAGIRLKAKTLLERERKALDQLTEAILLFLENMYVTEQLTEKIKRYEEWEESETEEPYIYEDILDEYAAVLLSSQLLDMIFSRSFFGDNIARNIDTLLGLYHLDTDLEALSKEQRDILGSKDYDFVDRIKNSKFSYLYD